MELQANMISLNQDVATRDQAIRMAGQLLVDAGCVEKRIYRLNDCT